MLKLRDLIMILLYFFPRFAQWEHYPSFFLAWLDHLVRSYILIEILTQKKLQALAGLKSKLNEYSFKSWVKENKYVVEGKCIELKTLLVQYFQRLLHRLRWLFLKAIRFLMNYQVLSLFDFYPDWYLCFKSKQLMLKK